MTRSVQAGPKPHVGSRIVMAWIELTVTGLIGGIIGTSIGGPPGLIIYFVTTLVSVGIIFYNVNQLIQQWIEWRWENERAYGNRNNSR